MLGEPYGSWIGKCEYDLSTHELEKVMSDNSLCTKLKPKCNMVLKYNEFNKTDVEKYDPNPVRWYVIICYEHAQNQQKMKTKGKSQTAGTKS